MSTNRPSFEAGALPVIPLTFLESLPYKREYEDAVRANVDDPDLQPVSVAVVRSSVERRREVAGEERNALLENPAMMEEYGQLFHSLDKDPETTSEERIRAFAKGLYLPSYETFARLAVRDEPDPASDVLAQLSFRLLVDAMGDDHEIEGDEPEAILKIEGLFPGKRPYRFAIASTKIDGLAAKNTATHQVLETKTRRMGVVDLLAVNSDAMIDSFALVANLHTIGIAGSPEEVKYQEQIVRAHQESIADYLVESGNYFPVIDRGYITRFGSKALADAYLVDPSSPNSDDQLELDLEVGPEFLR